MSPVHWLRKWREAESRPIPGNPPNDRILRGPDCHRHKRVCVDLFPPLRCRSSQERSGFPRMRLSGMAESIGPMWPLQAGAGVPPPVGRFRGPAKERDGRGAPCSSSAMSSGRLFLDRVARQQSPSPLHRQPDHKHWTNRKEGFIIERQLRLFPCVSAKGFTPRSAFICVHPRPYS